MGAGGRSPRRTDQGEASHRLRPSAALVSSATDPHGGRTESEGADDPLECPCPSPSSRPRPPSPSRHAPSTAPPVDSWQDGQKPLIGILSEEDQPGLAGADSPRLRRRYRRSPLNQPQGIRRIGRLRPPSFLPISRPVTCPLERPALDCGDPITGLRRTPWTW